MEPELPDYAAMLQQSMAAALAQVDALRDEVAREQERVADELAEARAERRKIEEDARQLAEADFAKHRTALEERMRRELYDEVIRRLLLAGNADNVVQRWLDVPEKQVQYVRRHIGADAGKHGQVLVTQYGRGGTIWYNRGIIQFTLDWEFGGSGALALIFVPSEAHWEAQTGLPTSERPDVLAFIGEEVARQQAPGHAWELEGDMLVIR